MALGLRDETDVIEQLLQAQAATYITWATLMVRYFFINTCTVHHLELSAPQAVTWDWTLALAEECQIVQRRGRSFAVFAYFLARASAVMMCVLTLIFYMGVPPGKLHLCT